MCVFVFVFCIHAYFINHFAPRWGTANAEIEVPSVENTECEGSPFKARGRSV